METPVASGSLEFAVLVTGFVVQTLSHELLVQDVSQQNDDVSGTGGGSSAVGAAGQLQKHLSHQLALFQGQQQQPNGGNGDDSRINELKAQVQVKKRELERGVGEAVVVVVREKCRSKKHVKETLSAFYVFVSFFAS